MTGKEETLCSKCMHLHVCSLKNKFINTQERVNGLTFGDGSKLRDRTFIRVRLDCEYFVKGNLRNCTLEGKEEQWNQKF